MSTRQPTYTYNDSLDEAKKTVYNQPRLPSVPSYHIKPMGNHLSGLFQFHNFLLLQLSLISKPFFNSSFVFLHDEAQGTYVGLSFSSEKSNDPISFIVIHGVRMAFIPYLFIQIVIQRIPFSIIVCHFQVIDLAMISITCDRFNLQLGAQSVSNPIEAFLHNVGHLADLTAAKHELNVAEWPIAFDLFKLRAAFVTFFYFCRRGP